MIQNFGGGEILVIIILALVVLGPERLPEMARSAGKTLHKLRTMTSGLQGQVKDVMDDPAMQPLRELGELAARPRQKLSEYALAAEAEERAASEAAALAAAVQTDAQTDEQTDEQVEAPTGVADASADPEPAAETSAGQVTAPEDVTDVVAPQERESA
jgi:sec-independent protein translocase protein TatB